MGIQHLAGLGAQRLAHLTCAFQIRVGLEQADGIGKLARISGVAQSQALALDAIAVEQSQRRNAFAHRGQFPAQIDRIFHCGVVTQATRGGEQMGGITHQENTPLGELFCHQGVASGPVLGGQNVHLDLKAQHLSHQLTRCRMVQGLAIFALVQGGMKGKLLLAIHRHQKPATLGIEGHIHPSPVVGN